MGKYVRDATRWTITPTMMSDQDRDDHAEWLEEQLEWVLMTMERSASVANELKTLRHQARGGDDEQRLLWLQQELEAFSYHAEQLRDRLTARLVELGRQP